MTLAALRLDRFAELANFVLQPGHLRFQPLVLLIEPSLMLELHGKRRHVGEVVVWTGLAIGARLAATRLTTILGTVLAARLAAAVLTTALVFSLPAPHEAVATAERHRQVDLLVIASHCQLRASSGLLFVDGADQIVAAADALAIDRGDEIARTKTSAGRRTGWINLRDLGALLVIVLAFLQKDA